MPWEPSNNSSRPSNRCLACGPSSSPTLSHLRQPPQGIRRLLVLSCFPTSAISTSVGLPSIAPTSFAIYRQELISSCISCAARRKAFKVSFSASRPPSLAQSPGVQSNLHSVSVIQTSLSAPGPRTPPSPTASASSNQLLSP